MKGMARGWGRLLPYKSDGGPRRKVKNAVLLPLRCSVSTSLQLYLTGTI